jgi:hypothetical protein
MMIERRIVVGLGDIQAVTFECVKCASRLSVPPDDIKEIPGKCPHCTQEWLSIDPSGHQAVRSPFVNFTDAIGAIRRLLNPHESMMKESMIGFRILLEFDEG